MRSDRELRIVFVGQPDTVTPRHIEMALAACSQLNHEGDFGAIIDIPTSGKVCYVELYPIMSDGQWEQKMQTWRYTLLDDDTVDVYIHTHL